MSVVNLQDLVVGILGKPSAGKSTFLNAVTDSNAKTGDFPFTTIEPNTGVSYYKSPCVCSKYNVKCNPHQGKCIQGIRYIPVKILDVAGLIPGASEGRGLGNKFLDDLRHATVLIHVVDVSGTTNEKGEKTVGYDPCGDIDWLQEELELWIYNNVASAWTNLVRKHVRSKCTPQESLISQLSGYGCNSKFIQDYLYFISSNSNAISSEPKTAIEKWTEQDLKIAMKLFVQFRFPSIIVLNKIDMNSSSKHVEKMYTKYDSNRIVCCSALSECVLKKYDKKGYIRYEIGTNHFEEITIPDKTVQQTLTHIKDLVLYRYDGTGVYDAIQKAVELHNPILCFPVSDFSFLNQSSSLQQQQHDYFSQCHVMKKGSTFKDLIQEFYSQITIHSIEGIDGRRISDSEVITEENCIFRLIK